MTQQKSRTLCGVPSKVNENRRVPTSALTVACESDVLYDCALTRHAIAVPDVHDIVEHAAPEMVAEGVKE